MCSTVVSSLKIPLKKFKLETDIVVQSVHNEIRVI